ncbi:hydroxymethylglutaryl-CoA lyase [Pseudomonas kuykendallii]|uniref:hydroxymethylglutaryl-CoA lyase n=1 Tax=Pseudomonas kuykendallii TaxID=1007099 RepID=UPI0028D85669|nr:hydroxymethylglutaryl-CoA lyase [Pseudomonas kuykendallii]
MTRLYIQEVATRDGFQIEADFIATETKIALIDALSRTGLAKIEATSFTSPKAIPNLRDAEEVMRGITRVPGVEYTVLVPNVKGCERALACGVDEINLVMSASDTHGLANLRMTPEQSLAQFAEIIDVSRGSGVFINASLSTTFGCPFEGHIAEERVYHLIERLLEIGVQGVTLCDTTGMANPAQVARICRETLARWPQVGFTLHVHDTRGMGLANALAAFQVGIRRFDASLGGLGGCPYAPGATGNVCTEDLVHMFAQMGEDTGVDLDALLEVATGLPAIVGHTLPGQVLKAGKADRRYPKPRSLQG